MVAPETVEDSYIAVQAEAFVQAKALGRAAPLQPARRGLYRAPPLARLYDAKIIRSLIDLAKHEEAVVSA
jgi:hypothetical protein